VLLFFYRLRCVSSRFSVFTVVLSAGVSEQHHGTECESEDTLARSSPDLMLPADSRRRLGIDPRECAVHFETERVPCSLVMFSRARFFLVALFPLYLVTLIPLLAPRRVCFPRLPPGTVLFFGRRTGAGAAGALLQSVDLPRVVYDGSSFATFYPPAYHRVWWSWACVGYHKGTWCLDAFVWDVPSLRAWSFSR